MEKVKHVATELCLYAKCQDIAPEKRVKIWQDVIDLMGLSAKVVATAPDRTYYPHHDYRIGIAYEGDYAPAINAITEIIKILDNVGHCGYEKTEKIATEIVRCRESAKVCS